MDWERLKERFENSASGRKFLAFASKLYGWGVKLDQGAYLHGFKWTKKVRARVVCIGNLTAGGTGKTTAVMLAAMAMAGSGIRVAIVSRGYKRQKKTTRPVILFENFKGDWRSTGDEPFMMSRVLAPYKIPIVVSPDRVWAAKTAIRKFKSQLILLDDGLQHYRLKRNANIVLVDAENPFGNGQLLPYGILREPLTAFKRAALVILTHCDQVDEEDLEDMKAVIHQYNPRVPVLESVHHPQCYVDMCSSRRIPLKEIHGPAACFCALGNPDSFENTLESLGLELKQRWRFPDHQHYTEEMLHTFQATREDLPLITTFKDFVKLPKNWRSILERDVYVLSVNLKIRGGEHEKKLFLSTLYPDLFKKTAQAGQTSAVQNATPVESVVAPQPQKGASAK